VKAKVGEVPCEIADSESTSKSPAFQFYPKDFLTSPKVRKMSHAERGVYITLLALCWLDGSLPAEPAHLATELHIPLKQFSRMWAGPLSQCFVERDGRLVNERLEHERQKQDKFRRRQSDAATKRWESHGNATALPSLSHAGNATASERHMPEPSHPGNALQFASAFASPDSSQKERVRTPHTVSEKAGAFSEWYRDTHERLFGIGYIGNPQRDYDACLRLCEAFSEKDLRDAALVWFGMDDDFATSGTRTIPKFASRASKCVELARKAAV
jgi:uncharacterized protein YdaU (DUF1376 family)